MWTVAADLSRNLLDLKFSGRVDPNEVRAGGRRVREVLAALKPGFTLLTDLSELTEMQMECRPIIDEMMDTFDRHGIGKVVRVIPDPGKDIGFGIMSLFHYREEVRAITCRTRIEAEEVLERSPGQG
jgi:hypothetical protein